MDSCIFCKIIDKKLSAYRVCEDKEFLAFLDIRPLTRGHTLVVPKKHFRWTYDVSNFGEYFEVARKVAMAAKEALAADWICFLTVGSEVPHAHIHVIPRYKTDLHGAVVRLDRVEKLNEQEMRDICGKISSQL